MEYIKKEELKEGTVYKANNKSLTFIMKATKDLNNVINIPSYNEFMKNGNFNGSYLTFINATSEEKHWLNTCIEQDKFITFEEAMKTFIPEYVECLKPQQWKQTIKENGNNLIFKSDFKSTCDHQIIESLKDKGESSFKPSTKEAYDAQFVVKEPEFVLPEKWYIQRIPENAKILNKWENDKRGSFEAFNEKDNGCSMFSDKDYYFTKPEYILGYTEITFEQFKKYVLKKEIIEEKVIEPLPQFKVIETIETITKVENNEGNQFFIGDVVIGSNSRIKSKIISFKYNVDKTTILAITDKTSNFGIGINHLEHYIEPKVEVKDNFILPEKWCVLRNEENHKILNKWCNENHLIGERYSYTDNTKNLIYSEKPNNSWTEYKRFCNIIDNTFTEITFDQFKKYVLKEEVKEETLLEKAKRLYPIGTEFKCLVTGNKYKIPENTIFGFSNSDGDAVYSYVNNNIFHKHYENNNWADIIK